MPSIVVRVSVSPGPVAGSEPGMTVQVVPFQCSTRTRIRPVAVPGLPVLPTAHTLRGLSSLTPFSSASLTPAGSGTGAWCQRLPFQCSASGWGLVPGESDAPTVQASCGLAEETAPSSVLTRPPDVAGLIMLVVTRQGVENGPVPP